MKKMVLAISMSLFATAAHAGTWTPAPVKIKSLGAWAVWFGVEVDDQTAPLGCSGTGTKAINITTETSVTKAQTALLTSAFLSGKKVLLYFEACSPQGVSLITNVRVVE